MVTVLFQFYIFPSIMLIQTLILATVYASTLCWHKPPRPSGAFGTVICCQFN